VPVTFIGQARNQSCGVRFQQRFPNVQEVVKKLSLRHCATVLGASPDKIER
jgi:hypothetical protein